MHRRGEFPVAPETEPGLRLPPASRWKVEHHATLATTQELGRTRKPWHAIVANEQTAGRGQADRSFLSEPGGLYLTAVLPYAGDALKSRGFALAVGWAIRAVLIRAGVTGMRLRWPNDLMVDALKVGGILVEQGGPTMLLVGVGLNVTNRPWLTDPGLQGMTGRLADAMSEGYRLPTPGELTEYLLMAIQRAHETFARHGLAGLVPRLNECWGPPRAVVIEPAAGVQETEVRGWFHGIDAAGHVLVRHASGEITAVPAHHIGRLREVSES